MSFDVVVPTVGRPSLARLLDALAAQTGPLPRQVIVADDRPGAARPNGPGDRDGGGGLPVLTEGAPPRIAKRLRVVRSCARGPAAARNLGWRAAACEWVVFLDDDVVPPPRWSRALAADLASLSPTAAGSQGRIRVPPPTGRRPTDWERNVAGLEQARWASADIAYRREALQRVGGFDERFARAYREDSDIALRMLAHGYSIEQGRRELEHPVGPVRFWQSVTLQRGNAYDALMRKLHGPQWRARAGAPKGRLPMHALICACAAGCAVAAAGRRNAARAFAAGWAAGTTELAYRRIAPGPRTAGEIVRMLATSALLPFAAVYHRLRGELRWRGRQDAWSGRPAAVLFDRDGTLVEDVPYNGDPALVTPRTGAREALDRLRAAGVPVGVISNQSGVGRGLLSEEQVRRVNARIEALLGPVDVWLHCPHAPGDGCECRKPEPGMVLEAARRLGVQAQRCAVVGDIAADVQAARAAGARGVLVPNGHTQPQEVQAAPETATDLQAAVALLLPAEPASDARHPTAHPHPRRAQEEVCV